MADLGVTFITSAFESVDDHLLDILDKGHSASDLDLALELTEQAGIAIRPTWLPFTPWTSATDYLALLEFIETRRLVDLTPPVQLGLRLLVPSDSPLVEPMREMDSLVSYDSDGLTWNWRHGYPRMDALQSEVAALAERQASFAQIKSVACQALRCRAMARPTCSSRPSTRPDRGLVLLSRANRGPVGPLGSANNTETISLIEL